MNKFTTHITLYAATYELIAILLACSGMVLMMVASGLAKGIILAGIIALGLTYCCQFYTTLKKHNHYPISNLTLNHLSMLVIIAGILLTVLGHYLAFWFLLAGWVLIILAILYNTFMFEKMDHGTFVGVQTRLGILALVSIVFFLSF